MAGTLQAGTGYSILTPPLGVELGGYGYYLKRRATVIRRNLYARALVLAQGGTRVALVACDLLGLSAEVVRQARQQIEAMTRVPGSHVLIACTGTHSAPATFWTHGLGEPDASYVALLPRLIASAVAEAEQDLEPARVLVGSMDLAGLARRRVLPFDIVDTPVTALDIWQTDSDQKCAILLYHCSPSCMAPEDTDVHTDFPGIAAHMLESLPEYEFAICLPGTFGDLEPVHARSGLTGVRRSARMLAGAGLIALGNGRELESLHPLRCVERSITLPLAPPDPQVLRQRRKDNLALLAERDPDSPEGQTARFWAEACDGLLYRLTGEPEPLLETLRDAQGDIARRTGRAPRVQELAAVLDLPADSVTRLLRLQQADMAPPAPTTMQCPVQVIQVGDIAFLAHPAQLYTGPGQEILRHSPFEVTCMIGNANGYIGYVPDVMEYRRRGYAAEVAPYLLEQFPFAPSVGEIFVEACVQLLEDVRKGRCD
ncbi:MAG: neutral/alkaline non-lysosomal ceramidase N-terminal domain-containing protein [Chloroherpetonaceae bacterium]|nr:neutral/alkaline non-lysosomal ceramidase N-terminal domain-containing protein [Chthonomonadaceae bacterium]MDW8206472.1 neutral/alkaline non-lysosomal ceramidase N-terminal domain-containing protein [Chloroherpetonaceae bacterium]